MALASGVSGHGGHALAVGSARAVVEAGVALLAKTAQEAWWTDAAESSCDSRGMALASVVARVGQTGVAVLAAGAAEAGGTLARVGAVRVLAALALVLTGVGRTHVLYERRIENRE